MIDLQVLDNYVISVCETQDLTIEQLKSKSRLRNIVERRMVLSYVLRSELGMTYMAIGEYLNIHHATAMYYCKKCKDFLDVYPHIQRMHKDFIIIFELYKDMLYGNINTKTINLSRTKTRSNALIKTLIFSNNILRTKINQLKEIIDDKQERKTHNSREEIQSR